MTGLNAIAAEPFGLFVDSGAMAVAIVIWLGVVGLTVPHLGAVVPYAEVVLFAGLAAILLASVIYRSGQRPRG
jgi:hypothetical protein